MYNKSATGRRFFPRDEVLILLLKMLVQWKGPYQLTEKIKPYGVNYNVIVGERRGVVICHINILCEYKLSILQAVDKRDIEECKALVSCFY
jgi:hypothetical protein